MHGARPGEFEGILYIHDNSRRRVMKQILPSHSKKEKERWPSG